MVCVCVGWCVAGTHEVEVAGRRTKETRKEKQRETTGGKSNEDTSSYPRRCGTMARSNLHQGWTSIYRPPRRGDVLYTSIPFLASYARRLDNRPRCSGRPRYPDSDLPNTGIARNAISIFYFRALLCVPRCSSCSTSKQKQSRPAQLVSIDYGIIE